MDQRLADHFAKLMTSLQSIDGLQVDEPTRTDPISDDDIKAFEQETSRALPEQLRAIDSDGKVFDRLTLRQPPPSL